MKQDGPIACSDDRSLPFPLLKTSLEIIRLAVIFYIRFPLSLQHVEDLQYEWGIASAMIE